MTYRRVNGVLAKAREKSNQVRPLFGPSKLRRKRAIHLLVRRPNTKSGYKKVVLQRNELQGFSKLWVMSLNQ